MVKSGSSPSSGCCSLIFAMKSQAGCMLPGMSSSLPPPATLGREVEADAVVIERDAAFQLGNQADLSRTSARRSGSGGTIGQHIDIAIGVDDRVASRPTGFASSVAFFRFGRSDRSSVTPRSADFVALVVVSQLMWIGGTRFCATAARLWAEFRCLRSGRDAPRCRSPW